MSNLSHAVIFKKDLTKPKDFEVCFSSIAKNELFDVSRQSMWVEIKDLIKFDTDVEKQKPNAITKSLHGIKLTFVLYSGEPEFLPKNSFQELSIFTENGALSAMMFCKAESSKYLLGALNALNTSEELSIWARIKISENDVINISNGLRAPIEHISLTFS